MASVATIADFGGLQSLEERIEELWQRREELDDRDAAARATVLGAMELLDSGRVRVAELGRDGEVVVHEWLKRAIVMLFRVCPLERSETGPMLFADRLPLKRECAGVRIVPGAYARFGSHVAAGAILMPSFVNVGAYVGSGTLVDTWATVGSCAQVGQHVHLSGGVGLGGVLEPLQAKPVDRRERGFHRQSLHVDRRCPCGPRRGRRRGRDPVSHDPGDRRRHRRGARARAHPRLERRDRSDALAAFAGGEFGLPCVLVIKRLAEGERPDKVKLNELVRAHGATL